MIHGYSAYMQWEQQQLKAPWFNDLIAELFPQWNYELCSDPQRQKDGVDLLLTRKQPEEVAPWDRREYTLDAKFRRKHYDDFLVEIRHVGPTVQMLGWGLRGLACDYLLYVTLESRQAVLFSWELWWRWWLRERNALSTQYPLQQAKNRSYTTYFVSLPWRLFEEEVPLVRKELVGYTEPVP